MTAAIGVPAAAVPRRAWGRSVFRREMPEPQPLTVKTAAASSLCGRTLDWVEALGV